MKAFAVFDRIIEAFAAAVAEGDFEAAEGWAGICLARGDEVQVRSR